MTDANTSFVALETPTKIHHDLLCADDPTLAKTDGRVSSTSPTTKLAPTTQLFAFADTTDMLLMVVGTLSAVAAGVSQPIQIVLLGDMINSFNPTTPLDRDGFRAGVNVVARNFAIAGAVVVFCGFLQVACWSRTASRQTKRIRKAYVGAILTSELAWFDVHEPMELASRVAASAVMIQNGMGRKLSDGINYIALSVSAIVIALVKGWELALVLLAFTPVIAVTGFVATKALSTATQAGMDAYGKAGAIAHESLRHVRTVHMFNAIPHFVDKYETAVTRSTQAGIQKGLAVGGGMGTLFFTIFCLYVGGLFYGTLQVVNDRRDGCAGDRCYDGGRVVTVFFATLMGAMALGQAGPCIEAFVSARAVAYDVFTVIHRTSLIDPRSDTGRKLCPVQGQIEIDRVSFAYPSRPDVAVCANYSLTIHAGETVALVGPSGSGKSTIVSLLARFYDPQSGSINIDGVDVRELNVPWLRAQIGLVGQEPVLFATTILENIRYGCPDATDEQVIEAATMANATSFITAFPMGFATHVGERGTHLSGGQKQRIAIARAILKNPPILLLDEATSALDAESERMVQQSLDALLASSSSSPTARTTVIVAHRLSTIRNADRIAVHADGAIVELGTHDELMATPRSQYRRLVEAQQRGSGSEDELVVGAATSGAEKTMRPSASSIHIQNKDWTQSHLDDVDDATLADDDTDADESVSGSDSVSMLRVWQLSAPEWKYLAAGSVGAFVHAAVFPVWAVLVTKMIVLFFDTDTSRSDLLQTARYWAAAFVALGALFSVAVTVQHYGFAVVAQRLTTRVRLAVFASMLQQEIGWFDRPANASGALVARLATDAATLQALTTDMLNQGLVSVTAIGFGFGMALYASWEMTLLLLATTPLFVFTSTVEAQLTSGAANTKTANEADAAAGALLAESVASIRTVASLGLEKTLTTTYGGFLEASTRADTRVGVVGGAAFGAAQGLLFFNVALLFYVGGIWVTSGRITFEDMFMVIMVIMLSMMAVGNATGAATDQAAARRAACRVFRVLDRTPQIDATSSTVGDRLPAVRGDLAFQHVTFAYPSRPDASVYNSFNLTIAAGETIALVGASGSGKSTAIALLERFYDPAAGSVTLDGVDLRALNVSWLRERIALVGQEPVLFAGTIADNIAMGKRGSGHATQQEIEDAAKMANAYDFIAHFPDGFATHVGDGGTQVSGGQKQRLAIARALLRDPDVLLLDEATSALDNESERLVQASLDALLAQKKTKKRTTIIVAHRLSTIRHADRIAVVQDGAIVEQGTHEQLLAVAGGAYRALVMRQMK